MLNKFKNVHTEHCCKSHGCTYDEPDCPVANGQQIQSSPCQVCEENNYQHSE